MTPPVCIPIFRGNGKRLWRWYGNRDRHRGGARNNAIATNLEGGVITVYNAGAGMAAYGNSNMVINRESLTSGENADYDANLVVTRW